MVKPELALCYYPTVVAFIDDSPNFLAAMKFAVSDDLSCITFDDPIRALNHANNLNNVNWNAYSQTDYSYTSDAEQFIKNTLNQALNKISDKDRYQEISVVVVDFDMPEMNGLEFCHNLRNPNIKKILLTGQAGFSEAIEAFNNNVIDYYIRKTEDNLFEKLIGAIKNLQNRYFLDISSYIKIRAIDSKKSLFSDAKLSEYFADLVKHHEVVEYYFLTNPPRYKFKHANGQTSILLVYSRHDLNEQIRVIKEEAGPSWLIDNLKTGHYVPYFESSDGYYDQESFNAQNALYLAHTVKGQDTFYCAHITDKTQALDPVMFTGNSSFH